MQLDFKQYNFNGFQFNRIGLLRLSIGTIYLWFGIVKFFMDLSPAKQLAVDTIKFLTFGILPDSVSIILLALLETSIGIFLFFNIYIRFSIGMALFHLLCTFIPVIIFPDLIFTHTPYSFTITGQYIMKNIIIVCALLAIYPLSGNRNQHLSENIEGIKNRTAVEG